jgi:hypothetical protein
MKSLKMQAALAAVIALATLGGSTAPASAAGEFDKYALESVSASLSSIQAGAHADFSFTFKLAQAENQTYAVTKDVEVHLPPGMIGNPQGVPRCTIGQFGTVATESECPVASQVGVTEVAVGSPFMTLFEPIYNLVPPAEDSGVVARFGFYAVYPTFINVRIDPSDYSLVASIEGAPSAAELMEATTTIWGVPAAPSHDPLRLTPGEAAVGKLPPGGRSAGLPESPFLSNPTDCSLARSLTVTARSYQRPDLPTTMSAPFPQIGGCNKLSFDPSFTAVATNPEAAAPTGLDATLTIPQDETPQGRATSSLRSAVVTLPEGMAINPSAGDGLAACSAAEVGFGTAEPSHCPAAAKLGEVELEVPALEHTLHGDVYQRTPQPGRLFGFWVVADEQGVHLKLPAEIQANPLTGQLTTVFNGIEVLGGLPQVPFSQLRLHVSGGPRAPLASPATCGTYQTQYSLVPWSGRPAVEGSTPMQITQGCGRGGFNPRLEAGTLNHGAGQFSPFAFTLTRKDGEANPQTIALHLPQGFLAKLGGVPLCPEADAASGNCPVGSRIGSLIAAAGVGGVPLWIPQPGKSATAVYLAGPYRGAPYSIVSVVPAQAGPFDLGTVVNRAAIEVDPETALATIKTDALPQMLEGVPVLYRTLHVDIDRPKFTLNPTSCARKKIKAVVIATTGASAEPTDAIQATDCAKLRYSPRLKLSFGGSTKRTGNPAVRAVLTQPRGQANTAAATVILPPGEFIDNAHISTPCTRVQFNQDRCPKASILGRAQAKTPLLAKPLRGPVYFRSNGGARQLPDIVADLHGPIRVTLVGYIDSVKTGPESSSVRTRFLHVPDAPVTRFTMSLFGGKRGLVENSADLCKARRRARVSLAAQNGKVRNFGASIATSCKNNAS